MDIVAIVGTPSDGFSEAPRRKILCCIVNESSERIVAQGSIFFELGIITHSASCSMHVIDQILELKLPQSLRPQTVRQPASSSTVADEMQESIDPLTKTMPHLTTTTAL
ncbi:hypothetical protein CR51_22860 [Caballeronia megalochromosomata]|nr:hypothetical protein CR51_22860 [Caballeronia megalochromosomata]